MQKSLFGKESKNKLFAIHYSRQSYQHIVSTLLMLQSCVRSLTAVYITKLYRNIKRNNKSSNVTTSNWVIFFVRITTVEDTDTHTQKKSHQCCYVLTIFSNTVLLVCHEGRKWHSTKIQVDGQFAPWVIW